MTTQKNPANAAAPLPAVADMTARQYATNATAHVLCLLGALDELGAGPLGDEYFRALNALVGHYTTAHLLRQIIEHAPEHADQAARDLRETLEAGDSIGEWAWEWGNEAGLDPDALGVAGAEYTKAKATETTGKKKDQRTQAPPVPMPEKYSIDEAAPLPDDPMETTAEQYANRATAAYWFERGRSRHLIVSTNASHPAVPDVVAHQHSAYAIAHLTNVLRTLAPQAADAAIRDLLANESSIVGAQLDAGRWADRAGLDIAALQAAGEQAAKEQAGE